MISITRRHALALGSTALLLPSALRAQSAWPTGPVTFVVGYAAGGGADINARELAQLMSPIIGQQIIVDNKGGATGSIGVRAVANAKPDGQTLFYAVGTNVDDQPVGPEGHDRHHRHPGADLPDDVLPVRAGDQSQGAANTAAELVALAKKDPEKLTFSSSGVGGNNHLAGALFAEAAGIQLTHVPYKGTGPALADVISGQITMNFSSLPPAVAQIKAGNLQGAGRDRREAHQVAARRADAQGTGHRRRGERLAWPVRAGQDARRHPRQDREGRQAGDEGAQVGGSAGQGRAGTAARPHAGRSSPSSSPTSMPSGARS